MIYSISVNDQTWGLKPLYDLLPDGLNDPRVRVGPEVDDDWTPPPLFLYKPKSKVPPADIWDYDHNKALAVTRAVAAVLEGEPWCRLFPLRAEVQVGAKPGKVQEIDLVLVAVTLALDVMDAERTQYKPCPGLRPARSHRGRRDSGPRLRAVPSALWRLPPPDGDGGVPRTGRVQGVDRPGVHTGRAGGLNLGCKSIAVGEGRHPGQVPTRPHAGLDGGLDARRLAAP